MTISQLKRCDQFISFFERRHGPAQTISGRLESRRAGAILEGSHGENTIAGSLGLHEAAFIYCVSNGHRSCKNRLPFLYLRLRQIALQGCTSALGNGASVSPLCGRHYNGFSLAFVFACHLEIFYSTNIRFYKEELSVFKAVEIFLFLRGVLIG